MTVSGGRAADRVAGCLQGMCVFVGRQLAPTRLSPSLFLADTLPSRYAVNSFLSRRPKSSIVGGDGGGNGGDGEEALEVPAMLVYPVRHLFNMHMSFAASLVLMCGVHYRQRRPA